MNYSVYRIATYVAEENVQDFSNRYKLFTRIKFTKRTLFLIRI